MKTFGSFLVSVLAAGNFATALPAPDTPTTGIKFSVPAKLNPNYKAHWPSALAKAYAKYNIPISPGLAKAVSAAKLRKRAQGSDPASPTQDDIEYLAEVKIGTPGQTFYLDFDTGSADLWTYGTDTPSSKVGQHTVYNPKKSSSSKLLNGASWKIGYGDHTKANGVVYTDTVSVGGVVVDGQAVEIVTDLSDSFIQDPSGGLLGLSLSKGNTVSPKKQQTFFDNAKGSLDKPLFTANLKHNADGTYNFGYIDDSEHTGDIAYAPVVATKLGYWQFTSSGYAIGSGDINTQSFDAVADTGSTALLLQTEIMQEYFANVDGGQNTDGGYAVPCDTELPDFSFGVGGSTITVPASLMMMGPTDDDPTLCYTGVQDGGDQNIFGDVALKAALVVFDGGNNQVGWAPKDI